MPTYYSVERMRELGWLPPDEVRALRAQIAELSSTVPASGCTPAQFAVKALDKITNDREHEERASNGEGV